MKNKIHLTIVQYRSNGSDYCMGCLMDSSDSDFEISHTTDLDEAARIIGQRAFEDKTSDREYASWDITILQNGLEEHFEEYDYDLELQIMAAAKEYSNILMKQCDANAEKERIEKQKQEDEFTRVKDLAQLAELLEKYPDEE